MNELAATELVKKQHSGSYTQTSVQVVARYADGACLICYNNHWTTRRNTGSRFEERQVVDRRVAYADASGRVTWDMLAQ